MILEVDHAPHAVNESMSISPSQLDTLQTFEPLFLSNQLASGNYKNPFVLQYERRKRTREVGDRWSNRNIVRINLSLAITTSYVGGQLLSQHQYAFVMYSYSKSSQPNCSWDMRDTPELSVT